MKILNSGESAVFYCLLVLNNFAGCGAELNISCERVRQIQVMAFNKMKLSYGEQ
jgi:hypothetical protein